MSWFFGSDGEKEDCEVGYRNKALMFLHGNFI